MAAAPRVHVVQQIPETRAVGGVLLGQPGADTLERGDVVLLGHGDGRPRGADAPRAPQEPVALEEGDEVAHGKGGFQPRALGPGLGAHRGLAVLPLRAGVADGGVQLVDVLRGRVGGLDEELLRADVRVVEEELAPGVGAVASRPAHLLVVGLQRAGHVPVDDEADVGPIHAHAEGVGGDDHGRLAVHEGVLHARALRVAHRAVVGQRAHAMLGEQPLHALDHPPRGAVDDARAEELDDLQQALQLFGVGAHAGHVEREVGPLEARHDDLRLRAPTLPQAQVLDDVAPHGVGGGGGDGQQAHGGRQGGHHLAQMQVVGAEVVAPGADAVRLVDGQHGQRRLAQRVEEAWVAETLGRHVDELAVAHAQLRQALGRLVGGEGGVQEGGGDAPRREGVHLVLHQRDERRDDHRRPPRHQRGQLEAEAFARPRRHDDERVAPLQHGAHHALLPGAEGPEAEPAPQRLCQCVAQGSGVA